MTEQEKDKYIEEVKMTLGTMCDYANGLRAVCKAIYDGEDTEPLIDMTLKRIIELGDKYI